MIENEQNSIESNAVREQQYNFGKGEGAGDYKYIIIMVSNTFWRTTALPIAKQLIDYTVH